MKDILKILFGTALLFGCSSTNTQKSTTEKVLFIPSLSSLTATALTGASFNETQTNSIGLFSLTDNLYKKNEGSYVKELNDCKVTVELKPDFLSRRIKGKINHVSCIFPSGQLFEGTANGFIVDPHDSKNGVLANNHQKSKSIYLELKPGTKVYIVLIDSLLISAK